MQNDIENILNEIAAKDLNAKTDFFLSADMELSERAAYIKKEIAQLI